MAQGVHQITADFEKELARYTNIKEVEVCKIINTIISTKILNLIREGKEEMNKIEYEEEVPVTKVKINGKLHNASL